MKSETEAKAIIVLIISLIAFGFGSGAGILLGLSQNDTLNTTENNNTQEALELPQIQPTENVSPYEEPETDPVADNFRSGLIYTERSNRSIGNNDTDPRSEPVYINIRNNSTDSNT